jgi:hypothetical protein
MTMRLNTVTSDFDILARKFGHQKQLNAFYSAQDKISEVNVFSFDNQYQISVFHFNYIYYTISTGSDLTVAPLLGRKSKDW